MLFMFLSITHRYTIMSLLIVLELVTAVAVQTCPVLITENGVEQHLLILFVP